MADALIQVGTVVTKEASGNIYGAIIAVIETCYECHASQSTIKAAIRGVSEALRVENVTITHCYLTGDRTVNMDGDPKPLSE